MSNLVPFDTRRRRPARRPSWAPARAARPRWWRRISPIMVMLPLALLTGGLTFADRAPRAVGIEPESAHFAICYGPARLNCVVDGDTFWYQGAKIRIADINTPETGSPACHAEAVLGARATERLHELLNAGSFTLAAADRDTDRYGRLLRVVTRDGRSLGDVLVAEGLAEGWDGQRGSWC